MHSDESAAGNISWGPWIIALFGCVLLVCGAARFILRHRFGFIDVLYCCLAIIPSGLFLLVFSYVLQHAKLASIIPLLAVGLLVFTSPVADVALGLALLAGVTGPALSEWKNEKRFSKSTTPYDDENE